MIGSSMQNKANRQASQVALNHVSAAGADGLLANERVKPLALAAPQPGDGESLVPPSRG